MIRHSLDGCGAEQICVVFPRSQPVPIDFGHRERHVKLSCSAELAASGVKCNPPSSMSVASLAQRQRLSAHVHGVGSLPDKHVLEDRGMG